MGASVRRLVIETGEEASPLNALFLDRLIMPRVSVFSLLEADLGQRFNLDNGLAVQELLWMWMRLQQRRVGEAMTLLGHLKTQRRFCTVWWEARAVKVFTWPEDLRIALVQSCRVVIQRALASPPRLECPEHGCDPLAQTFRKRPTVAEAADICSACSQLMLDCLRMDYKCIDLR